MDTNTIIGLIVLVVVVFGLAYVVNQHSMRRKPIYGGPPSILFNFLAGLFFVAILPTICMSVFVFHPGMINVLGITFHPIVFIIVFFALLSLVSTILFAIVEKSPMQSAIAEQARREAQGWTEEDARTSGL